MNSIRVCVHITTERVARWYSLRPLAAAELQNPFVAAFRVGYTDGNTAYQVSMAADGAINCTCEGWQHREKCKHADALQAAGVFQTHLAVAFTDRGRLIHQAEAEANKVAEQASTEAVIHQHDREESARRIAELETDLAAAEARCRSLAGSNSRLEADLAAYKGTKPRRRRGKAPAVAA